MANNARTIEDLERKYDFASLLGLSKNIKVNEKSINKVNTELLNFITSATNKMDDLSTQVDKKTEIWFDAGKPTLDKFPANEWEENDKAKHIGDLYYDTSVGYSYRFSIQENEYLWLRIVDSDITEALRLASTAQDTADGKRRVFMETPMPPYDEGDLYVKNQELYICNVSKTSGNYEENDFIIATKYTDDTKANQAINNLNDFVEVTFKSAMSNLTNQIDGKISTWYYSGEPTLSNLPAIEWNTDEDKIAHTGDLYYDKLTGYTYLFEHLENTYKWSRIKDEDIAQAMSLANSAQDTADNKRQIFVIQPTTPYSCGDLWISSNEIYICQIERLTGDFDDGDWINNLKYTDNTYAQAIVDELGGTKTQVLEGTVTQYTKKWVKFTDLSTGGSTVINGSNIKTGTINTDNVTIGNGNVQMNKDGIKLKNGAKVIGENGLMNTYLFTNGDSFEICGYEGYDVSSATEVYRKGVRLIFNIPEGLNITSATLILFHAPIYWGWYDADFNSNSSWGYCRSLKVYKASNINSRKYTADYLSEYFETNDTQYSEINSALGANGWTPSVPTNSSHITEKKISTDIKSSLSTGLNELFIQPSVDITGILAPSEICSKSGFIYAMLKINGYMSYN